MPELSRTMAYITRNTVNRLARKELNSNPVVLELSKENETSRGTQRIVSVNYLFGRPLIPSDFLERIVASNSRGMTNLMSVAFGLLKMSFWVP